MTKPFPPNSRCRLMQMMRKTAAICAVLGLLAGLIPPPAVQSLIGATLPNSLAAPVAQLADALLPDTPTAQAAAVAPIEAVVDPSIEVAVAAPVASVVANAVPGGTTSTQITGNVFRDFNSDGLKSTGTVADTGVSGVTVTAYDATGAQAGVATTAGNGDYTITGLTAGMTYRVEFSTLPTGYYPTTRGSGVGDTNGTTVQFAAAGTSQVSLGLNRPCDYCQSNPQVMTTRQKAGDISGTNVASAESTFTRDWNNTSTSSPSTMGQTGSLWGVAYDRDNKHVYSTAFLKRQSGLGPRGLDGIYVWNNSSGTPALLGGFDLDGVIPSNGGAAIDLGSVTRSVVAGSGTGVNQLSSDPTLASRDDDAFAKVGKVGFGDADIGPDNKTLWTVNLNQRTLVAVDTSLVTPAATNPNLAPAAAVKQYNILTGGPAGATISGAPACTSGQLRPFGLGFSDTAGYLGVVCDGSSATRYSANVVAYVLAFDPATPTSFTTVASVPMNYTREASYYNFDGSTVDGAWQHWFDTYSFAETNGGFFGYISAPQPMLSDIDIMNDGSLVLGFTDRWTHQQGWANYLPGGTIMIDAISTGDILRAYKSGATYVIEGPSNDNTGVSDYNSLSGPGGTKTGFLLNDGPNGANGGEFFFGDEFTGYDAIHGETSLGGIAVLPGSNEVLNTSLDPKSFNAQGLRWFSATTGNKTRVYERVELAGIADFGKGAGLGDIELLCDPAPIEIGNRVWLDDNHNGIQDPGEESMKSVTVVLHDGSGNSYTAVTNAQGEYYFNESNVSGGLQPNTAYTLTIDTTQSALAGYELAPSNVVTTSTTIPDGVDSDGIQVGSVARITLTTGNAGENDHSFDFGFHDAALSLGNRLFYDTNNDGLDNDGSGGGLGGGISNVTVQLLDHNNVVTATTTTDGNGYYRFDDLTDHATYTVLIPASNFAPGGKLAGYQNSTATFSADPNTSADDANDNGVVNGILGSGGDVRSAAITLIEGTLPMGEPAIGGGTHAPDGDRHDDLTVDFGFYKLTLYLLNKSGES